MLGKEKLVVNVNNMHINKIFIPFDQWLKQQKMKKAHQGAREEKDDQ